MNTSLERRTKYPLQRMQMEREGYKDVSEEEAELYASIGKRDFYKIVDFGFRNAYWSCKFMEVVPGDRNYREMFEFARKSAVRAALQVVYDGHSDYAVMVCMSDKEIVKTINEPLEEMVEVEHE